MRNRTLQIVLALVVVAAVVAGGVFYYLNSAPSEASADVNDGVQRLSIPTSAPSSAGDDATEGAFNPATLVEQLGLVNVAHAQAEAVAPACEVANPAYLPEELAALGTATEEAAATETVAATEDIAATEAAAPATEAAAAGEPEYRLFRITQDESRVSFRIGEDLSGRRVIVEGVTDQVAGDVLVNLTDPTQTQIGAIRINVRTLETDSGNRNGAIRRFILRSGEADYEFTDFTPAAIEGLPTERVAVGETLQFDVTGDLPLVGVSAPVTFSACVVVEEEGRLVGRAETLISRATYGIEIPSVPQVANVTDEVVLVIDFVALEVTE